MADDPENPDPSAPVSVTDHPNQDAGVKAKSQTTQGGRGAKVSPGGPKRSNFMTQLIGVDELRPMMEFIRQCEAEFWGTLLLVFFGVGSCVVWKARTPTGLNVPEDQRELVPIALSFGLAVATIAQMLGHISGAHLNPAVSFGLVARGNCGLIKAGAFFGCQLLGALFGALIYYGIVASVKGFRPDTPYPEFVGTAGGGPGLASLQELTGIVGSLSKLNTGVDWWQGILNELIITFPLIFVICAVCDPGHEVKGSAPLAIGLAIAVGHLAGIPASGASMNPARSIGPWLVAMAFQTDHHKDVVEQATNEIYVYVLGPILGGVLAGIYYRFRFASERLARNQGGHPVQITQTQMLAPAESQPQMSQSHHTQSTHPPQ